MAELRSVVVSHFVGLALRLGLLVYGTWQDAHMNVKYTDVDYYVFSDAARYISQGESPYQRSTYRYTPLLAWLLVPNIYFPAFGKLLFVTLDMVASLMIYSILKSQNCAPRTALFASMTWLFNPLSFTVSTRGNAESLMAVLVLGTLLLVTSKSGAPHSWTRLLTGGALYGLAVHTKIYPVTFASSIYLSLRSSRKTSSWTLHRIIPWDIWLNKQRLVFGLSAAVTFLFMTTCFYYLYGWEFLEETYLYHVTRRDTRHNFSPYFYMLYLTSESAGGHIYNLLAFLPQLLLLILTSCCYHNDLPFCTFLQTFIFVTFNKVCTSQYFLWYLSLFPLLLPHLRVSVYQGVQLLAAWFMAQALWLYPAYKLEFEGQNTFLQIWLAGLVFFSTNVWILCRLVSLYKKPSDQSSVGDKHHVSDSQYKLRTKKLS